MAKPDYALEITSPIIDKTIELMERELANLPTRERLRRQINLAMLQLQAEADLPVSSTPPDLWRGKPLAACTDRELQEALDHTRAAIAERRKRNAELIELLAGNRRKWGWRRFFFGPLKDPQL